MNPFFSVVISVFNKEKYINNTIQSVINQSYENFEIIIVNDGSTDKSLDIINSIKDDRIRIISTQNMGASACRNTGIEAAKSDYIALLDGDDLWEPIYLETIFEAIKKHPQESVFATAIAQKYANKIVPVSYNFKTKSYYNLLNYFKHSLKYQILTSSSIVFEKKILETTGKFDTTIKSGQDTDLWIRFGIHFPVVFINSILVYYVYDNNSLSNTTFKVSEKLKFDKYLEEETKNKDLKKVLDRYRFSLAIFSKLYHDDDLFRFYKKRLLQKNLTLKQRILIQCPKWVLELLLKLKSIRGEKLYYKSLKS